MILNGIRSILFAAAALVCVPLVGCAPYLANRGRDASDIITATVGVGHGVKARLGPFYVGLFNNSDKAGVRGGYWLTNPSLPRPAINDRCAPFPVGPAYLYPVFGYELFYPKRTDQSEGERYDEFRKSERHKSYYASSPVPFISWPAEIIYDRSVWLSYNSDIQVAAGIGGTVRLGINLAEILDFALGWTTLDILDDDIGMEPHEAP